MFPNLEKEKISHPDDARSCEWHDFQLLGGQEYHSKDISHQCLKVLQTWKTHAGAKPSGLWISKKRGEPDHKTVSKILRLLKRNLSAEYDGTTILLERDRETDYLTSLREQALHALRGNTQMVFEGPAGTGKTFIARALAKRASDAGRRILLLCHTHLLARWLECALRPYEHVTVCTLSQLQFGILGLPPEEGVARKDDSSFWSELPERSFKFLCEERSSLERFDEVIIDEAQDLFDEHLMHVIDLLLIGGWKGGRWTLCGDWERQRIFGSDEPDNLTFLETFLGHKPFRYMLDDNCRNTPSIARLAQSFAGEKLYNRIERSDAGPDFDIRTYRNAAQQQKLIQDWIHINLSNGYKLQDMVVLSFSRNAKSVAGMLAGTPGFENLRPFREATKDSHLRYGSVHGFKGLEARAVIVTDVNGLDDEYRRNLLYVAVSRARDRLVLLVDKDEERQLQSLKSRNVE